MRKITLLIFCMASSLWMSKTTYALGDINGCGSKVDDIEAAANAVLNNWKDWEAFVEAQTGVNIKKCMKNRFENNGKVICESSSSGQCKSAAAWSSPLNKKIHLCPTMLSDIIEEARKPDRRACYAAIMAHEFAHSCDRFEVGADALDEATFDWYVSTHNLTIKKSDCGFM